MADLDPDQAAALLRLRAAFGFVEVLAVVDHEADQAEGDNEARRGLGRDHWPAGSVGGLMPRPHERPRARPRRRGNEPTPVAWPQAAHSRDEPTAGLLMPSGPPPRVMGKDVVAGTLAGFIPLLLERQAEAAEQLLTERQAADPSD